MSYYKTIKLSDDVIDLSRKALRDEMIQMLGRFVLLNCVGCNHNPEMIWDRFFSQYINYFHDLNVLYGKGTKDYSNVMYKAFCEELKSNIKSDLDIICPF